MGTLPRRLLVHTSGNVGGARPDRPRFWVCWSLRTRDPSWGRGHGPGRAPGPPPPRPGPVGAQGGRSELLALSVKAEATQTRWGRFPLVGTGRPWGAKADGESSVTSPLLLSPPPPTNPAPGLTAPGAARPSCTLTRTVGASVQLQLRSAPTPDTREIEWSWTSEQGRDQLLVSWSPRAADWYDLDGEHRARLWLTAEASLHVENVTMAMSGVYAAKVKFKSGKSQEETFRLCLYEPILQPQIRIRSLSNTSGWCNISLECVSPGATENLTVAWLDEGLPWELRQQEGLGAASGSKTLSLWLPWGQSHGHLTCMVSSPVEKKNATLHLDSVCPQSGSLQSNWLWAGSLPLILLVSLGAGALIWARKKRETWKEGGPVLLPAESGSAPAPLAPASEANDTDNDDAQAGEAGSPAPLYLDPTHLRHPKKDTEQGGGQSHSLACNVVMHTIYDNIKTNPEPQGSC